MDEEFDQWSSSWENKISGLRNSFCDSIKKQRQRQDRKLSCRLSQTLCRHRRAATLVFFIQVLTDQWFLLFPLNSARG